MSGPATEARFVVAIDGPAAAGKGTIAKAVAKHFGFAYLDTGLLYRAVGARALLGENPVEAARKMEAGFLNAPNLRSAEVANKASEVAALPDVRSALFDFQRHFAQHSGGAVLDGRDIGTAICPDAEVKLFITATPQTRAKRRLEELKQSGTKIDYQTVLKDVKARDARDMSRKDAPLVAAEDARVIDTTALDIGQSIEKAIAFIRAAQNANL